MQVLSRGMLLSLKPYKNLTDNVPEEIKAQLKKITQPTIKKKKTTVMRKNLQKQNTKKSNYQKVKYWDYKIKFN